MLRQILKAAKRQTKPHRHILVYFCRPHRSLSLQNLHYFLLKLYIPPWLGKTFRFIVSRLLENAFPSQKIESLHFHLCHPHGKLSGKLLSLPPKQRGIINPPPGSIFFFFLKIYFLQQKGGRNYVMACFEIALS